MPEVDYSYFLHRVEEPKHRRMFLGWPNVCQEFYVLSNGAIGVSSGSGQGTGHPPAEHFVVQFGAGEEPMFKEHGDPSVTQEIEDGYHIIVHTKWKAADAAIASAALAYPLAGEDVRTGNEPLAAFVRVAHGAKGKLPLWLKIRPDHWGGPEKPLAGLAGARVESSCLIAGDRTVLGIAAAKATIAAASDQEVLLKLEPEQEHVDLVIPYIAVDKALVTRALDLGFDEVLSRTKRYWDSRLAAGAIVDTPDPVVNNLYKTLLPRTLVCGDLDVQGDYVLKTSPIIYDAVWLHATAYGIEGLARRGHFREARQYLEAAFRWQGSQASDAKTYTTWKGFFNAPPRYTALLWINFHGWMQWAAARYFLFSDDRPWLEEKLPALIESLEWTASQRRLTMHDNPDGTRPDNYGWLPPGRVTDGSAGTSTFSDCINWMGFNELTRLLERIGHPRAGEFRAEADDYRACILRGLRRADQSSRAGAAERRDVRSLCPRLPRIGWARGDDVVRRGGRRRAGRHSRLGRHASRRTDGRLGPGEPRRQPLRHRTQSGRRGIFPGPRMRLSSPRPAAAGDLHAVQRHGLAHVAANAHDVRASFVGGRPRVRPCALALGLLHADARRHARVG